MADADVYLQRDQPEGVPPLALTGERTMPDVPEENYWFRRHLVVYEWIARRVAGLRVLDLACGEGYGTAVLAERAAEVVGVDADPVAYEHARLKYARPPRITFACEQVERYAGTADAVVFLQTIEHLRDPGGLLEHVKALVADGARGGIVYLTTPNVLTLAPPGAERSDNPFHVTEYRARELRALCSEHFTSVELLGLYHARKLAVHALALRLGWDAVHQRLRITRPFYDRFTPAIAASDFALRRDRPLDEALDLLAICRP